MDLEETKKIIRNKIEADESAREVRNQIKSYIHEKQNLREGFTETFKPLIETSEAVKTSIDTQQNKLIKQLQDNQLALTEGLNKNRLAITSGFDKMDEVKRWDLSQLPGLEANEEEKEEKEEEEEEEEEEESKEDILEKINDLQNLIIKEIDIMEKLIEESNAKSKSGNIKDANEVLKKAQNQTESIKNLQRKILRLQQTLSEEFEEETVEKSIPKVSTIRYEKKDMDQFLNNLESSEILRSYNLGLPSTYKDLSLKKFQKALDNSVRDSWHIVIQC